MFAIFKNVVHVHSFEANETPIAHSLKTGEMPSNIGVKRS